MKTVIFLNKWSNLYHLMLASVSDDGKNSRRLDSRYTTSLEQARKAVAYWMATTPSRFIKQFAEFRPADEVRQVPKRRRGFYFLYKQSNKAGTCFYNVVYVGKATKSIKSRLRKHLKSKRKEGRWTHFSAFEVLPSLTDDEITELEGLFRHLYRRDSRANLLNRQKRFSRLKQARQDDFAHWT